MSRYEGGAVAVAITRRERLLGLAWLDREEAPRSLLIPRCRSVHTFGMRFSLDLYWLDADGAVAEVSRKVPPRRFTSCRRAAAVLEVPASG
jgi:uncharacterized protein